MELFTSKLLSWKEIGGIKLSVLCIGIAIGSYWPAVFAPYIPALLIVGIVLGLGMAVVWMKN